MAGLLRGVARTAMVAGAGAAVGKRVSRRQSGGWDQHWSGQQQPAPAGQPYPPPAPAGAPPADPMESRLDQLRQLGELKSQGVLTEAEFEQQKARILGS